jgi:hypothetical protein
MTFKVGGRIFMLTDGSRPRAGQPEVRSAKIAASSGDLPQY